MTGVALGRRVPLFLCLVVGPPRLLGAFLGCGRGGWTKSGQREGTGKLGLDKVGIAVPRSPGPMHTRLSPVRRGCPGSGLHSAEICSGQQDAQQRAACSGDHDASTTLGDILCFAVACIAAINRPAHDSSPSRPVSRKPAIWL